MSERAGFDRIIGQQLAKRVLARAVRSDRPAHAYLFLGLQSTGKTTTALEFAKALNCENPIDGGACAECLTCRSVEHGNFPDIRVWSPDGQNTKIEQMRELRELANFRPLRGEWKVNIIEQGDTLSEDSANSILKVVEEPPDYLVNILLYRNAASVIPTIRSRCQLLRFTQASTEELTARLTEDYGINAEQAEFLATYSQGRPGAAIEMVGNTEFFEKRDSIARLAEAAASRNPWLALKLAESLRPPKSKKDAAAEEDSDDYEQDAAEPAPKIQEHRPAKKASARDGTIESLDMLLVWYRDLLAAKLQGEGAAVVNSDRRDDILRQCQSYKHAGPLVGAVESILRAKRGLLGNANPQIVTEALMMRLVS